MIAACTGRSLTCLITGEGEPFTDNARQKRFLEEEIKKWWILIFDALDKEDKSGVIMACEQGGLNAVFSPEIMTGKRNG